MERITGHKIKWEKIPGAPDTVMSRPPDPEIVRQMPPPGRKPFTQVGLIEWIIHDIKKFFHPDEEIPY